jgi:hypothetical protein
MARARRSTFEIIVVIAVVAFTVVMGAGIYAKRVKLQKSELLIQELAMLRSSLAIYKILNHQNAESLAELAQGEYDVDGAWRPYVDKLPPVEDGDVLDPFGSPYAYDKKTGWVLSTTPGFESW